MANFAGLSSPLIKSICYERLHSTQASFSIENDLNVASGHDFGHFRSRALPAPACAALDPIPGAAGRSNSHALATTDFINGLLSADREKSESYPVFVHGNRGAGLQLG